MFLQKMGNIELATDAVMLQEAVVVAEAPQVTVVEDTLMYNSSAYRTPEGLCWKNWSRNFRVLKLMMTVM